MGTFDLTIIAFVNRFSRHSWVFDNFVRELASNALFKGCVLVTIIWWAWFKNGEAYFRLRLQLMATLLSSIAAMILARGLALVLPFRPRPLHDESLQFLLPYGLKPTTLDGWSSMPSDHAVLFFSLSAGLLFVSRKVGIFAVFYTTLFIAVPRVYLGYHYPSDIIVSAFIGIAVSLWGNIYLPGSQYICSTVNWSSSRSEIFYPVFFMASYLLADMFNDARTLAVGFIKVIKGFMA